MTRVPRGIVPLMPALSVTLVDVGVPVTVVPGGIFNPLTDMPTPTDSMLSKGSVEPAAVLAFVCNATVSRGP